jgi:hypothetical protein
MSTSTPVYGDPSGGPLRPNPTWFERNWKWFVPALLVSAALLVGLLLAGVLELVTSMMTSSGAYKVAVQRARESPQVAEEFGSPLKVGWFTSGNISVSGETGVADLSIPISGPREKGRIVVHAKKEHGTWTFQTLEVEVDGEDTIIPLLTPEITAPGRARDLV